MKVKDYGRMLSKMFDCPPIDELELNDSRVRILKLLYDSKNLENRTLTTSDFINEFDFSTKITTKRLNELNQIGLIRKSKGRICIWLPVLNKKLQKRILERVEEYMKEWWNGF